MANQPTHHLRIDITVKGRSRSTSQHAMVRRLEEIVSVVKLGWTVGAFAPDYNHESGGSFDLTETEAK